MNRYYRHFGSPFEGFQFPAFVNKAVEAVNPANVYMIAFVKALISLLTRPSKFNQSSTSDCVIGRLRSFLPEGTNIALDAIADGLGINYGTMLGSIYWYQGGQHYTQARTRAKYAVLNAIRVVTDGKPLTGTVGLLKIVEFLLRNPSFKYNQGITGRCLYAIFNSIRTGKPADMHYDHLEISRTLGVTYTGSLFNNDEHTRLFCSGTAPAEFRTRIDKATQQRTKNTVAAIRVLSFIVNRK